MCLLYHLMPYMQVYNEQKINSFWAQRPGELVGRWANFTAVSGGVTPGSVSWQLDCSGCSQPSNLQA
jgi:hypothetical protein